MIRGPKEVLIGGGLIPETRTTRETNLGRRGYQVDRIGNDRYSENDFFEESIFRGLRSDLLSLV